MVKGRVRTQINATLEKTQNVKISLEISKIFLELSFSENDLHILIGSDKLLWKHFPICMGAHQYAMCRLPASSLSESMGETQNRLNTNLQK